MYFSIFLFFHFLHFPIQWFWFFENLLEVCALPITEAPMTPSLSLTQTKTCVVLGSHPSYTHTQTHTHTRAMSEYPVRVCVCGFVWLCVRGCARVCVCGLHCRLTARRSWVRFPHG